MSKTSFIRARTEIDTKKKAEHIFKILGLTSTQALNLFYKQVIIHKGFPFELKIPNEETKKVFEETNKKENLVKWHSIDEIFHHIKAKK